VAESAAHTLTQTGHAEAITREIAGLQYRTLGKAKKENDDLLAEYMLEEKEIQDELTRTDPIIANAEFNYLLVLPPLQTKNAKAVLDRAKEHKVVFEDKLKTIKSEIARLTAKQTSIRTYNNAIAANPGVYKPTYVHTKKQRRGLGWRVNVPDLPQVDKIDPTNLPKDPVLGTGSLNINKRKAIKDFQKATDVGIRGGGVVGGGGACGAMLLAAIIICVIVLLYSLYRMMRRTRGGVPSWNDLRPPDVPVQNSCGLLW
jgi:hypothetical protein